jgi:hypothetical protein
MSTLNVDKVDPSTGTTLELGTSGDTVSIPSGVTIANSGTATGFGAVLTGSTNNQVTTVTAANAIQGETNLIYDGTILGCGATGASADLGVGIHVRTADSGASAASDADELIIEGSGDSGISILTSASNAGNICFGDDTTNDQGRVQYNHNGNYMLFETDGAEKLRITSDGRGISEFTALAWVRVAQTGTMAIDDSQNVSSIVDDGAGKTTVNFDNNMANANYAITMCSENNSMQGIVGASVSTSAFELAIVNSGGGYEDRLYVSAVVHGTQ